jgi:hypothetical protein
MQRARGAIGMAIVWAMIWAPAAVLIGTLVDPDDSMDEMWVAIGAYAGFLGGLAFSIVLGIAARHRRFEELSLPRVTAWGAAAGLMVGSLPFLLATPEGERPLWPLAFVVVGTITLLSAGSAAASLALARRGERRELLAGPADVYSSPHDEETDRRLAAVARDRAGAARGDRPQAGG